MKCEKCEGEHDGTYGSGRFCSIECANSRGHIKKTKILPCVECGNDVEVVHTFPKKFVKCIICSPPKVKRIKRIKICPTCGIKLTYRQKNFCSKKCEIRFKFCMNVNLWLSDEHTGMSGKYGTASWIKKYLIETRKHKCEVCDITEWMGKPVPLILDHIDGHFKNNNENNLRLVCGNCDMQLPTFKSKNMGNGRYRN